MPNTQATTAASDRSSSDSFVVPNNDNGYGISYGTNYGSSADGFVLEDRNTNKRKSWYIHIDNGWDTSVDATVFGSHLFDLDLSTEVTDGSVVTVGSGNVDFVDGTTRHSALQLKIQPSSTPTSGDLVITLQSRKG